MCLSIFEDRNSLQRKGDDVARNITKIILPAITKVADVLNDTRKGIAPIGLVKVICVCDWHKSKQIDTFDTINEQKSGGKQMLESHNS